MNMIELLYNISSRDLLIHFISVSLILSSAIVISSNHPIFCLVFLGLSFVLGSLLLIVLGCEFLALLFILVYVGAIMILFLFTFMLLETKYDSLFNNSADSMLIGCLLGGGFSVPLLRDIEQSFRAHNPYVGHFEVYIPINWYSNIDSLSDIEVYGQILYSYFVLQFLISGVILLLVLVGVVYLVNNLNSVENNKTAQVSFRQLSRTSVLV